MDEIKTLKDENTALKKQVLVETIRRLSSEMQAASASMAAIQMRIPQIEQEMLSAKERLAILTKESGDGPTSN